MPIKLARHFDGLLASASASTEAGDLAAVERLLDRARRLAWDDPGPALTCASLQLRLGRPGEALSVLDGTKWLDATPEWGLIQAEAHLALGNVETATELIEFLLHRYEITSLDRLPAIADVLIAQSQIPHVGWIGLGIAGSVTGMTAPGAPIAVADAHGSVLAAGQGDAAGRFNLELGWTALAAVAGVQSSAGPLLGGIAVERPAFRLEGEVSFGGGALVGWARLGWSPTTPVALLLRDENGVDSRLDVLPAATDHMKVQKPPFSCRPAALGLKGVLTVTALLPDGSTTSLAGSPVRRLPRRGKPIADLPARPRATAKPAPRISVVVPVYGGREETMACLRSVLRTIDRQDVELIAVIDASPDARLVGDIEALADSGRLTLLRNDVNLGFPASANRGIGLRPANDVVLLNADAEVYGDWLDRLRRAAYAGHDIGIVTPLSNRGSIVSYPTGDDTDCDAATAADHDFAAGTANRGRIVDLPTGIGFCLYLRRDCLDQIGLLDADTFGHGYGEEDDFCLRARREGWRSVAATDVYVRHGGAVSFGPMREMRIRHATKLIERLHPGYLDLIRRFSEADPLRLARRALDEARIGRHAPRSVLFVTVSRSGGISHHLETRRAEMENSGYRAIELMPNADEDPHGVCRLRLPGQGFEDLVYALPEEIESLTATLSRIGVERVEFHHFLRLSPVVLELPARLGVPYDVWIHDYVWICPRIMLVDGNDRYCGEPQLAGCDACIAANGATLDEPIGTGDLRRRSLSILQGAGRVVAPSFDVTRRLHRYFPEIPISVEPWERIAVPAPAPPPAAGDRIRVALIGRFGIAKGFNVLRDCARDAKRRDLPIEFVLIGHSIDDEKLFRTGRVFVTGDFAESEITYLLARERCQIAFFPSICPETWCYALSHALRAGLPAVAFDFGALAERLRDVKSARLLRPELPPAAVNDALLELASLTAGGHNAVRSDIAGKSEADRPRGLGRKTDVTKKPSVPASPASKPGLSSSSQVLTLAEGLYAFSVRGGSSAASPDQDLALPALHVAAAPSVSRNGLFTVLTAPSMSSPWLTQPGDVIVVQISDAPCRVVMTSLGAPNTKPLDIEVRRLDQRQTATAAAIPEPARILSGSNQPEAASSAVTQSQTRLQVLTHIQNRGDVPFVGGSWAGFIGQSVWMEAFALTPQGQLPANAIEYKARTAGGFETPWLSGGVWCGTRGMGVPLVEFAVRLIPEYATSHDCEYNGAFFSGSMIGPLRNGAPCRSRTPNDPLEAIQIRITERPAAKAAKRKRA